MLEDLPNRATEHPAGDLSRLLDGLSVHLEELYAQSRADHWQVSPERFAAVLERSASKASPPKSWTAQRLEQYFRALHLEDLVLATACADGCEPAWEGFYNTYRPYLRSAAAAILRCKVDSAEACDLADSLFSELYGLSDGKGAERSLFRYFHGRSSLKTWLRAVLAQRHIDSIRAAKRFEALPEEQSGDAPPRSLVSSQVQPDDPHRERYVASFTRALRAALELLEPQEKDRLRLYYAEEKTLAETGRLLGEHESSVSRHLDRVRRELRESVEEILRQGLRAANGFAAQPGLSDAEIQLCFDYSAGETPIDLDNLLPRPKSTGPAAGKVTP